MTHGQIVQSYFAEFMGIKSLAKADDAMRRISEDWAERRLSDEDYGRLSWFIHELRGVLRKVDTVALRMPSIIQAALGRGFKSMFPPKKRPKSPDKQASRERRGVLASTNPLPSQLHRKFTEAQRAVLKVVGDEVKRKGWCQLYVAEIAARAGCCMTTARDAIHLAASCFMLTVQERRRNGRPHLSNTIRIISHEWRQWIASPKFFAFPEFANTSGRLPVEGAPKVLGPTDKGLLDRRGITAEHLT